MAYYDLKIQLTDARTGKPVPATTIRLEADGRVYGYKVLDRILEALHSPEARKYLFPERSKA